MVTISFPPLLFSLPCRQAGWEGIMRGKYDGPARGGGVQSCSKSEQVTAEDCEDRSSNSSSELSASSAAFLEAAVKIPEVAGQNKEPR